jgi:transcriptional regulator with XRE-family HTH domain
MPPTPISRLLESVAGNVQRLRKARGLTQDELARIVGVDLRTIQRIEAGELTFTIALLSELAEGLEAHPAELVSDAKRVRRRVGRPSP